MLRHLFAALLALSTIAPVSAQVTDTLGWADYHAGTQTLYTSPNGGFAFGNNGYGDRIKAQSFASAESFVLRSALVGFGGVTYTSGNPESVIRVVVYDSRGVGRTTFGMVANVAPDSILAYKDVPVSALPTDGSLLEVDLSDSSLVFFERFSIGIDLTLLAPGDTVGLFSNTDGDAMQKQEAWELEAEDSSAWISILNPFSWGLDVALAIFPLVDKSDPASVPEVEQSVRIWPNPTSGAIHLELPNSGPWTAELLGMDGKVLRHWSFQHQQESIDLHGMTKGMVFLRIQNGEQLLVKRIIIQ